MKKIRIEFEITETQYERLKWLESQKINWRGRLDKDHIQEGIRHIMWLSERGLDILKLHDSVE